MISQLELFPHEPRVTPLAVAYADGTLARWCRECDRIAPNYEALGHLAGPRHTSPLGHRDHCSCGGCW